MHRPCPGRRSREHQEGPTDAERDFAVGAAGSVVPVLVPLALEGPYSYVADRPLAPGSLVQVPLGPRDYLGVVWPGEDGQNASPRAKLRPITAVLDTPPLPTDLVSFIGWVAAYTLSPLGTVLRMALRAPDALGPEAQVIGFRLTGPAPERMTSARARVIGLLAEGGTLPRADIAARAGVSPSVIDGLVRTETVGAVALPALAPFAQAAGGRQPELSDAQASAAARLRTLIRAGGHRTALLDGVTGSGKTEVYLDAVAAALDQGRQALILLPEIALTPEFLARYERRFGAPAAEWHSQLARRERERVWRGVRSGQAQAVIGARSALFLPFQRLGLVVIDEEHEPAFKQEDGVAYHARDMGVVRAMLADAPAVLASATPSLESHVNAEAGKYERLVLPRRHADAVLPRIEALDLRKTPPERGRWLAPPLVDAAAETLAAGEQVLLFLNRRGYAPLVLCRTCGHRFACPACAAWLVEHRFHRELRCHHCGFAGPVPVNCPECGGRDSLVACGPGVERIVEEAKLRFPESRVAVLSSDHLRGLADMRAVLEAVRERRIDVVVGTQLVAKGHHFPHLTLVGVVDADFGLAHSDPRAAERTYQLLHQVAGRAGRAERPGRVLLQTHMPHHPVLRALVEGDRDGFYDREAEMRREAGLPPFGRLVSVLVSGPDRRGTERVARTLALAAAPPAGIDVLGPAEAPIAVIRGRHRFRLLVKAARGVAVQDFVREWLGRVKVANAVRVSVDVDPQSFM
jgi:primosomal protein N' (replication factor Y)